MIFQLALRNVLRNKRRSLLTTLGIGLALCLVSVSFGLNSGQWVTMMKDAIDGTAGHLVVQAPTWQDDRDAAYFFNSAPAIEAELQEAYPDATITRRVQVGGLLSSTRNNTAGNINGVEPETEARLNKISQRIVEGEWLSGDSSKNKRNLVIGRKMADTLGVGLGDKVVFSAQVGEGSDMESVLYRVTGIFQTGTEALDAFTAYATVESTYPLLHGEEPAHQIAVVFPKYSEDNPRRGPGEEILQKYENTELLTWDQALPSLKETAALDKQSNAIIFSIMGLIAAVGVMNTVLMSVMERIREFGIMLAIGMKPGGLARMVLVEGFFIGILGSLLGVALAIPLLYYLSTAGIDFGSAMNEASPVPGVVLDTVIRAELNPMSLLRLSLTAIFFCLLSSIIPALRASKLQPVDAMRHL